LNDVSAGCVLIAGVSGLVGYACAELYGRKPGWQVIGLSRRLPAGLPEQVELQSVDLTDSASIAALRPQLQRVTHVVYAALHERPGLVAGWLEREQIDTNAAMFRNLMKALLEESGQLRHVNLLQGTKAYGAHLGLVKVPAREREPRVAHENFYWEQEDHLRALQRGKSWHYSIFRPQIIFGKSLGSAMNLVPALGVYGALLKAQGEPLYYPGGPELVLEAIDADLLAAALYWAATAEKARNETFNITNGDVFTWPNLWPAIADSLGMEPGPPRPMLLGETMSATADEWDRLREQLGLTSPGLKDFVGESFHYADFCMASALPADANPPPVLVSTVKLRQAGFSGCLDTEDMFRKWFRRFQAEHLLPAV
jgi:nucleoside-diphosphate-sugar epimerase